MVAGMSIHHWYTLRLSVFIVGGGYDLSHSFIVSIFVVVIDAITIIIIGVIVVGGIDISIDVIPIMLVNVPIIIIVIVVVNVAMVVVNIVVIVDIVVVKLCMLARNEKKMFICRQNCIWRPVRNPMITSCKNDNLLKELLCYLFTIVAYWVHSPENRNMVTY